MTTQLQLINIIIIVIIINLYFMLIGISSYYLTVKINESGFALQELNLAVLRFAESSWTSSNLHAECKALYDAFSYLKQ